ncbi:hypothetical protein [Clostridium sp. BL-8]|uniref:hypothetical protein n=1 Tax=Clostridium sp. BL-8 TaxID=349938 RepID=UPI00098BF306|nr:hypothetical protein [Clostridium sp. BL-8]OOM76588.1 hypothetical protein CLOBL_34730 [Clostridium sp. BL-8]
MIIYFGLGLLLAMLALKLLKGIVFIIGMVILLAIVVSVITSIAFKVAIGIGIIMAIMHITTKKIKRD